MLLLLVATEKKGVCIIPGYATPAFDFSVPGVTSMSVDTHKYGMAHKGTVRFIVPLTMSLPHAAPSAHYRCCVCLSSLPMLHREDITTDTRSLPGDHSRWCFTAARRCAGISTPASLIGAVGSTSLQALRVRGVGTCEYLFSAGSFTASLRQPQRSPHRHCLGRHGAPG